MNPIRILIIEDEPLCVETLLIYFKIQHLFTATTDVAKTLKESMDHLSKQKYDVILCDLRLPDSDGINTVKVIHAIAPHTPLLIVTGLFTDSAGTGQEYIRAGASDVFLKSEPIKDGVIRRILYEVERKRHKNSVKMANKRKFCQEALVELGGLH